MTADHEARIRAQELWAGKHEMECAGRHRALNLRFDQVAEGTEEARMEAAAARKAAEAAVVSATAAAAAAVIGRATILGWLRGLVLTLGATMAMLLSGSPWVQTLWKLVKGAQ